MEMQFELSASRLARVGSAANPLASPQLSERSCPIGMASPKGVVTMMTSHFEPVRENLLRAPQLGPGRSVHRLLPATGWRFR